MKVLVTGGNGFVGLNLAEALLARGDEVVLFDLREPPAVFVRSIAQRGFQHRMRAVTGDVCDSADLARVFADAGITHVFQGAAITAGAVRERSEPDRIFEVNLGGTLKVLAAMRDAGVRRVLYPSSVAVYGESLFDRAMVTEDDPALPEGLYGISKYAAERAALRLGGLWGIEVVVGRIGNVFGPWENETGVRDLVTPLAQVAAHGARGHEVLLPDMQLHRDLIYSRDLAAALVALLDAPEDAPVMNLSVIDDWSDIYQRWCRQLADTLPGFRWRVAQAPEAANVDYHDARARGRLYTTRLRRKLGFSPAFTPHQALADYAQWLGTHRDYFALGPA